MQLSPQPFFWHQEYKRLGFTLWSKYQYKLVHIWQVFGLLLFCFLSFDLQAYVAILKAKPLYFYSGLSEQQTMECDCKISYDYMKQNQKKSYGSIHFKVTIWYRK